MGRPARIGRAAILDAALELADQEGLDAVTMHAIARRMNVSTMALYRHMDGKDALLDGLVERLLTTFPAQQARQPGEQWLTAMASGIREVALRHPAVFPLLLTRPAVTPAAQRVRDAVVAALQDAGLTETAARRAERLLSTAVLGFAASEAAGRFRQHQQAVIDQDFAELLRWLRLALTSPPTAGENALGQSRPGNPPRRTSRSWPWCC
jgi:AcrR family transcriptional regulator